MIKLLIFCSWTLSLQAVTTVPSQHGKAECIKREINRILSKTKFSELEITEVNLGSFVSDDFLAKDKQGSSYSGFINSSFSTSDDEISCRLDTSSNFLPALFINMSAFALYDESGKTLYSIMKTPGPKNRHRNYLKLVKKLHSP